MEIKVDNTYDIYKLIKEIKNAPEMDLDVLFLKNSSIYQNASNLLIIKEIATQLRKKIIFNVENQNHTDYITNVNENRVEFTNPEIDISHESSSRKFNLPNIGVPVALGGLFSKFKKNKDIVDENPDAEVSHNVLAYSESGAKRFIKPGIIVGLILVAVVGLFYIAMLFVPSASVDIKIETESLVKLLEVKAEKDATVNVESRTIPALAITVSESETQTAKATGKKTDGTKAEGKVTITNKTGDDIKLKKNTILKLISSKDENLKYVLVKEVTVPKKEEKIPEGGTEAVTTYGTKEADIQAIDFGDKYNFEDGEKFEIDDYDTDELIAENDKEDIDGGKLVEKTVVTQPDMDALKKVVETALKEKLVESLKRKTITSQKLMESTIKYETVSANYTKKLDEEAEEFNLSVTMSAVGTTYSESDLDSVVKEAAKTVVPEKFNLDGENIEYDVAATVNESNPNTINIQVKLKSFIIPKFDTEKMRKDLSGKSLSEAQEYIEGLQNVSGFEIKVSPPLPGPLMRMPTRPENIQINIEK